MIPKQVRKRPIVVEALRWNPEDPDSTSDIIDWVLDHGGTARLREDLTEDGVIVIETIEGEMSLEPGGYVIRGVEGEFYPCKESIFVATYEDA